jgi:cytochrome c oxidase subunit 2
MAAGATFIFAIVIGLFLLVVLRPGFGRSFSQRAWILGGGLGLPIPLLLLLLAYSFQQGEALLHIGGPTAAPLRIEARSRMWAWEFVYLDEEATTSTLGVLHIPAGTVVEVTATSEDVIHSFWVPRLSGKVDAIPGHGARVRFLVDTPGTYRGACAEFCGPGHSGMFFSVRAHTPEDYTRAMEEARDASRRASLTRVRP